MAQEKSLEEIADLITEAVFAEGIIKKADVRLKVLVLIKGFVKVQNSPSMAVTDASPVKMGERANLVDTIDQKNKESLFWRSELRNLIGESGMKPLYDKLKMELLKDKFKTA